MGTLTQEVSYGSWPHLQDEWKNDYGPGERNEDEDVMVLAIDLRRRGITGDED
jgi:hypothetical protein